MKFTLVVDNDTTLHGVQTDTVAFSPTVLIKCSICSYPHSLMRTPPEWLKKTTHDKSHAIYCTVALGWRNVGDRCSSLVAWLWTVGLLASSLVATLG